MLTKEQRAHDLALAALQIVYDKRKAEADGEPVAFNPFQEYFKLYREALYAIGKTLPSDSDQ